MFCTDSSPYPLGGCHAGWSAGFFPYPFRRKAKSSILSQAFRTGCLPALLTSYKTRNPARKTYLCADFYFSKYMIPQICLMCKSRPASLEGYLNSRSISSIIKESSSVLLRSVSILFLKNSAFFLSSEERLEFAGFSAALL